MRTLAILVGVIAVVVAVPALAPAKSSPGVIRQGKCSGAASWKLKAKLDDGLIETEFEVDQNVAGRRWNVVITRDGATVFRGARVTRPPSGSFTVERRIRNSAGSDRIVAKATAARGGQVCRGVVTI
ncbi:MAG TPA: hypothetical protein VFM83_05310 [Gaiellaceae bacterium]|nr:hypothetical protein [Gaiellaceae bacterium]